MKEVKFSTSGFFAPAVITLKNGEGESEQIELIAFIPREEPPVEVYKVELDAEFCLQPTVAEILDEVAPEVSGFDPKDLPDKPPETSSIEKFIKDQQE